MTSRTLMKSFPPTSLTGRLVTTVVALVALAGILVATATTLAMRDRLSEQLDDQVVAASNRGLRPLGDRPPGGYFPHGPEGGDFDGGFGGDFGEGPDDGGPDFGIPGQPAGTLSALYEASGRTGDVITDSGSRRDLSTTALDDLSQVPADGRLHTVDLPAVGTYRVLALDRGDDTFVVGLPTDEIDEAVQSLVGLELLFTLGGVIAAGAIGLVLVRRQLRPLREVAATAHEVTELPLESGEIGTTVRVPPGLTDPRTEVGQVGAALNTMLAHVESALDARHRSEQQVRQFVADASHELRTPLTTIQGYAELSRRTHDGAPAALAKVEAEAQRMSALVEDLLLLARLDAGRPLASDDVDLTKLVLEAVADARVVGPDHRWLLDLPDEPVHVTGDEHRLHQAVTNLLTNARRHTPEGTTVTVGLARLNGRTAQEGVLLTVRDDGPGLPPELVGSAFERFTRGDSARTRSAGGAGLGLSLVQAIAEAHGGRATLQSSPADTTFTLHL